MIAELSPAQPISQRTVSGFLHFDPVNREVFRCSCKGRSVVLRAVSFLHGSIGWDMSHYASLSCFSVLFSLSYAVRESENAVRDGVLQEPRVL